MFFILYGIFGLFIIGILNFLFLIILLIESLKTKNKTFTEGYLYQFYQFKKIGIILTVFNVTSIFSGIYVVLEDSGFKLKDNIIFSSSLLIIYFFLFLMIKKKFSKEKSQKIKKWDISKIEIEKRFDYLKDIKLLSNEKAIIKNENMSEVLISSKVIEIYCENIQEIFFVLKLRYGLYKKDWLIENININNNKLIIKINNNNKKEKITFLKT